NAFNKMADAAKKDGRKLVVTSSYRPYSSQKRLYNNYVSSDGKQAADTYSARPGHSEHQTGLVVDLAGTNSSGAYDLNAFEASAEYTWMRANAYKYGFILRFPKEDEKITGYMYEPWHYRYVGLDTAKIIYEEKLCFEKYWAKYLWNKEN
ncbi:MAG: M15 family metallopeptidase, partial [Oscillospiraceae bacterium]